MLLMRITEFIDRPDQTGIMDQVGDKIGTSLNSRSDCHVGRGDYDHDNTVIRKTRTAVLQNSMTWRFSEA
jgi:hypothetical protein